jgi:hypothetical protein
MVKRFSNTTKSLRARPTITYNMRYFVKGSFKKYVTLGEGERGSTKCHTYTVFLSFWKRNV